MHYYYFNPFSKQYYFPDGFENYPIFNSFYQPYTFSARLMWFCWRSLGMFRGLFLENRAEKILPIDHIKRYTPASAIMAFNRGTPGKEQKITILGVDQITKKEFFIKYAESSSARKNVINEGNILVQLNHLEFVPKLLLSISEPEYALISTTVLKGQQVVHQQVMQLLIDILLELTKEKIEGGMKHKMEVKCCFAHGDFCPWNMMIEEGKLKIFDWEMAGNYPLGYDLFTYIFQTSFLISPNKSIEQLLKQNKTAIGTYFNSFNIDCWEIYLIAFAGIKLKLETEKQNKRLMTPYQLLKLYAEKM